jgi:hypothetical protein
MAVGQSQLARLQHGSCKRLGAELHNHVIGGRRSIGQPKT